MCSILFPRHEGSAGGGPCPHMAEFISEGFIAWKIMPAYVFMEGECERVAGQCSVTSDPYDLAGGSGSYALHPCLLGAPRFFSPFLTLEAKFRRHG